MKLFKNIIALFIVLSLAVSCEKEIDNLDKLNGVTAPANVSVSFDITQDNTGLVTVIPNAEGVTEYMISFGDTTDEVPTTYGVSEKITHTYAEGVFTVGVTAAGLTGLTSFVEQELNVTFKAPENLDVVVVKDGANPMKVNVTVSAELATVIDIYFGDVENEVPVHADPLGETVSHTYANPGDYLLKAIAKSGGAATLEYSETVNISELIGGINLPIDFESFTINYAFSDFGNAVAQVIDNPDPSGINTSARVGQFTKPDGAETWAGSLLTLENPIDFSVNKLFKMKVWSPKAASVVKLKVENIDNNEIAFEVDATTTVTNQWEELSFDFSGIDMVNDYQKVVVFFDFGNPGDDATYFFDDIKLTGSTPGTGIAGTWKMAPEAGSLGVGPDQGDISWWAIDDAGVVERACYFDDLYVFNADGSFNNVLQAETWIEGWQGGSDACGPPVAPHDGSVAATYNYDEGAGTVTLDGTGAYLGIPKAYNGGELTTPGDAPESITYIIEMSENDTRMTIDISIGGGWWRYILVKEGGSVVSPLEGAWQVAPEAGSLGVGPNQGDMSWWAIDDAGVAERACFFDDTYVFDADGSFSNVLGLDTWIEDWQGGSFTCDSPVAPHDGSTAATYSYDGGAGKVTLNGTGAYLGIPKAYNGGELTAPEDAPASITYILEFSENDTVVTVDIEIEGGWWRYKLVKL